MVSSRLLRISIRLAWCLIIQAIIYYAPIVFGQIGLEGGTIGLLATGVVGIVNFLFTIPAVLFVDNVSLGPGRRLSESILMYSVWSKANVGRW